MRMRKGHEAAEAVGEDSRPRWLLVCLALATALLTFRIVALLVTVLVTLADDAPSRLSSFARSWEDVALLAIPLFCAVLIGRWQEFALSGKSRKASYIALFVTVPPALFPLRLNIERTIQPMAVEDAVEMIPVTPVTVEYRLVDTDDENAENLVLTKTGEQLPVSRDVLLDLADVTDARPTEGANGFQVLLRLNEAGSERLRLATERYQGRRLAVVVDGQVVAVPKIIQPIHDGVVAIPGPMSEAEAFQLAKRIKFSIRDQGS